MVTTHLTAQKPELRCFSTTDVKIYILSTMKATIFQCDTVYCFSNRNEERNSFFQLLHIWIKTIPSSSGCNSNYWNTFSFTKFPSKTIKYNNNCVSKRNISKTKNWFVTIKYNNYVSKRKTSKTKNWFVSSQVHTHTKAPNKSQRMTNSHMIRKWWGTHTVV